MLSSCSFVNYEIVHNALLVIYMLLQTPSLQLIVLRVEFAV